MGLTDVSLENNRRLVVEVRRNDPDVGLELIEPLPLQDLSGHNVKRPRLSGRSEWPHDSRNVLAVLLVDLLDAVPECQECCDNRAGASAVD